MSLLTGSLLLDSLGIITGLIAIFLAWYMRNLNYWKRRGVITPKPSFPFGNSTNLFLQKEPFSEFIQRMYFFHRRTHNQPHGGIYFFCSPSYMPIDPEVVKNIMQNDFNHFVDRGVYVNEEADPLTAHLFALEGQKWKNLRAKLTPTFTSGKMKMMFDTLVKCSEQLTIEMDKSMEKGPIDIKNILMRFTTDIIGNCAFGIDCNSLKDPDNEFTKYLSRFFTDDSLWDNIKGFLTFIAPDLMRKFGTQITKTYITKFFMRVVKETVDYREKNNIYRKDFMHLLLQLKNRGKLSDDQSILNEEGSEEFMTFNELAAQAFVFFLAGFETSSTTMTFCLFELSSNPDIQEKVRQEVDEVLKKHDNKLTYEAIMEMHYMEKVINETLRKYPPLSMLNRICTKEYKVPGTDLILEKGTKVAIPVMGIQHDPEYYPDPEKFDPERFTEENKRTRHPYTFIPFGEGPRVCIGLRFGMMQTKVGLIALLKNYRFTLNSRVHLPLKFDPKNFIITTEEGIWLDYKRV